MRFKFLNTDVFSINCSYLKFQKVPHCWYLVMQNIPQKKDLPQASILAVDDDEWFLRLLIKKFQDVDPGFLITPAISAEEAVESLSKQQFDCILCDHKLPGTITIHGKHFPSDGINLMRKFTEMNIETPVIFITGQGSEEIASQALLSGASGYFIKRVQPGYFSLMATSIRQTISRYWLQRELQTSEARYRDLFENSAGLIIILDTNGNVQETNRNFQNLLGYSIEEIKDLNYSNFAHHEDLEKWKELLNDIMNGEEENQLLRLITKDGSLIHLDITARPIWSKDSKEITGIQAIARDITHQIETQQALIDSEEKHRAITEESKEGVIILENDGTIIDWNKAATRITGIPADETISKPIWKIMQSLRPEDTEDSTKIDTMYKQLADISHKIQPGDSGEGYITELKIKNLQDSITRNLEISRFTIDHSRGYRVVVNLRDITERYKAEKERRALTQRYQTLIEQGTIGVWVADLDETTTYVNEALANLLGYSTHEMIGTPVTDYLAPQHAEELSTITQRRIRGESIETSYELELYHRSGKKIYALVSGAEIRDENQQLIETYGFLRDITSQKQTNKELEETKEFLESVINSMTDGLYTYDSKYRISMANPRMAQILGYQTPHKLIGKNLLDLFPEKERHRVKELTEERLRGIKSESEMHLKYLTLQGDEVETIVSSVPLIVDGRVKGAGVTVTDVSEKIRIGDVLRSVQDEYNAVISNISLGVIKVDNLGKVVFYNQRAQELLSFTEVNDLSTINILNFAPFNQAGLTPRLRDILYQKSDDNLQFNVKLSDSKESWHKLRMHVFPVRNDREVGFKSWFLVIDEQLTD